MARRVSVTGEDVCQLSVPTESLILFFIPEVLLGSFSKPAWSFYIVYSCLFTFSSYFFYFLKHIILSLIILNSKDCGSYYSLCQFSLMVPYFLMSFEIVDQELCVFLETAWGFFKCSVEAMFP